MEHLVISVAGQRRHALFVKPSGVEHALPLVVLLHGKGGTAQWAIEESRLDEFATANGFALLAPDAYTLMPDQEPKFLSNPQIWNADPMGEFAASLPDDVAFFDQLLSEVTRQGSCDPRRIYVTGFSNGAAMTFRLAIELGHRLAAIAPVAGNCLMKPERIGRAVPTLWLLGEVDPMIPVNGGWVNSPWGKTYERPPMRDEARRWTGLIEQAGGTSVMVSMKVIPELGHHWPGGLSRLNPKIFGPGNVNFPGNETIWEFFKQHQLG